MMIYPCRAQRLPEDALIANMRGELEVMFRPLIGENENVQKEQRNDIWGVLTTRVNHLRCIFRWRLRRHHHLDLRIDDNGEFFVSMPLRTYECVAFASMNRFSSPALQLEPVLLQKYF